MAVRDVLLFTDGRLVFGKVPYTILSDSVFIFVERISALVLIAHAQFI